MMTDQERDDARIREAARRTADAASEALRAIWSEREDLRDVIRVALGEADFRRIIGSEAD